MFIAKRPCSFAGRKFKIGDLIPEDMVKAQAKSRLINGGYIAKATAEEVAAATANEPEEDAAVASEPVTEADLLKLTKDELLKIADELNIFYSTGDTKRELAALILEAQGSDA